MPDYWVDFQGSIRIAASNEDDAFGKADRLFTKLVDNSDYALNIDISDVEKDDNLE